MVVGSVVMAVALLVALAPMSAAKPGQTKACNGCHAYPPTLISVSTDITSTTVAPGDTFTVNISWSGGATDGTINEVNWPTDFSNVPESRDNALFSPSPRIPYSGTAVSGTTLSTLTAPSTAGTYVVRVYVSVGSWASASKETDYQDITVTVTAPNNPPVANDDSATTQEDTPVTIDVLANDTDADGDPLTVTNLTQAGNGTVSLNADKTVTYTPNSGFVGDDTFTYTANDGTVDSNTATVTVTVEAAPTPAVSADLVKKSAWPEHHHFDISKDEDAYQTLYGLVRNTGTADITVWVEFNIYNGSGLVATVSSNSVTLTPGSETVVSGDWLAVEGKYSVTAQAKWNDTGSKVKSFSFSVVP
jgi:hypothetical protein